MIRQLAAEDDVGLDERGVGFFEGGGESVFEGGGAAEGENQSHGQDDVGQQGQKQQDAPAHKLFPSNACHTELKNAMLKKLRGLPKYVIKWRRE